jgi:3-oxoacyl-[acyl-carrier protein] reductase
MTPDAQPGGRPVALVTGGSRGIGKAIVQRLARAGVEVHFTYVRNAEAAQSLVDELSASGAVAYATRVDAADMGASRAAAEGIIAERGRLDVLVHNAGVHVDRLLPMMSDAEWSSVLNTSLNGLFGASRPAATQMMRQRSGRIVNITSVSGLIGIPGQVNYCSAKAAVIGFTRSLAHELARWGVAVNAVAPGFVETDMLAGFTPAQRTAAVERVPMRRFASPEEVAALVGWLAIEAPQYLTGQTIAIDGGLTA